LIENVLLFSLPFLPYAASAWIINRSALYFIAEYGGIASTGSFGVAAALAGLLYVAYVPVQTVLYPMVRKAHDEGNPGLVRELSLMAVRYVLLVGGFGIVSLCFGSAHAFRLACISSAVPSSSLLLLLGIAAIAAGVGSVIVNLINLEMNTRLLVVVSPLAALLSLAAYYCLVPTLGLPGAAIGLLAGSGSQAALLGSRVPRSILPTPSPRFLAVIAISTACAAAIQWAGSLLGTWPYFLMLPLSGLVYSGVAYRHGALEPDEKTALRRWAKSLGGRLRGMSRGASCHIRVLTPEPRPVARDPGQTTELVPW
jgi:O-antigen/teichoic acid export membrane protein